MDYVAARAMLRTMAEKRRLTANHIESVRQRFHDRAEAYAREIEPDYACVRFGNSRWRRRHQDRYDELREATASRREAELGALIAKLERQDAAIAQHRRRHGINEPIPELGEFALAD